VKEGRLYIFTEYVAGGSVESLLSTYGKFSEGVVRRYAQETLEGLAYLHKEGILHRDIKPANVKEEKRKKTAPFPSPDIISLSLCMYGECCVCTDIAHHRLFCLSDSHIFSRC
jgi:serine/threonine protein kinase